MDKSFYIGSRRRFLEAMPEGAAAVFFSGEEARRSADVFFPFEPEKNFLYLTGIDRPGMALVLVKRRGGSAEERLFLPPVDETREKWYGVLLRPREAEAQSGVKNLEDARELMRYLAGLFSGAAAPERVLLYQNLTAMEEPEDQARRLAGTLRRQFPHLRVENSLGIMTALRYQKQPEEIDCIRRSAALLAEGLSAVRALLAPGRYEYEARAAYEGTLLAHNRHCYGTVCARGGNACCLHHDRQTGRMEEGELFLIDVGAPTEYYWADVSRTYPVSGRMDDRQRAVYEIVLAAQHKAMEAVRPGIPEGELQAIVEDCYARDLKTLGLIRDRSEVPQYYYHNIGHPLGLDVHDLRPEPRVLAENAVYTLEPGLYIAQWGLGVRIEDDVLVTKDGCENLTAHIPKDPAAL